MGIQSTQYITREVAIKRIMEIDYLIFHKRYRDLEHCTSEHNYHLKDYVDGYYIKSTDMDLTQWTDTMLEDKMDEPFYRFSMFDNYFIKEGE